MEWEQRIGTSFREGSGDGFSKERQERTTNETEEQQNESH